MKANKFSNIRPSDDEGTFKGGALVTVQIGSGDYEGIISAEALETLNDYLCS